MKQECNPPEEFGRQLKERVEHADKLQAALINLTAQLAVAQAQAKAWEGWGLKQAVGLTKCRTAAYEMEAFKRNYGILGPAIIEADATLALPPPQPVDASSLARIARVVLDGHKYVQATQLGDTYEEEERFEELHSSVDATTSDDIALAQALVGGA